MSDLISDIVDERIDTRSANAAVAAGGKLLKVVEMQHRYGRGPMVQASPIELAKGGRK